MDSEILMKDCMACMEKLQFEFEREIEKRIINIDIKRRGTLNKVVQLGHIRDCFCEARNKIMKEEITEMGG